MKKAACTHCCTKIEGLTVRLGGETILDSVDLHIDCGELLAIVGPNGAGKTTLLRALLGEIPYSGQIHYRVRSEPSERPKIGYVPQRLSLDVNAPISVMDFVAFSVWKVRAWLAYSSKEKAEIRRILERAQADHLMGKKIGELSGGELQRVLLAVAMTPVPDLLLLDEPVSAVDPSGLDLFYKLVSEVRQVHDVSIILITHDLAGIAPHADRVIFLCRQILAEGRPEELLGDAKLLDVHGPSLWNISKLLSRKEK